MYKELDIQIAINTTTPDIQIGLNSESKDVQLSLEKRAIFYEKDYENLINLPSINSVQLIGNKTSNDLGLQDELPMITRAEIREIINQL